MSEQQSSDAVVAERWSFYVTSCPDAQRQSYAVLKGSHWKQEFGCRGNPRPLQEQLERSIRASQ